MFGVIGLVLAKLTVLSPHRLMNILGRVGGSMLAELLFAFGIVAICVAIHTCGIVLFADWLLSRRHLLERRPGLLRNTLLLISIFAVIIVLHVVATAIWALFYLQRGLFTDPETAFYFSLGSYTTIGYCDVVLPHSMRLLGAIEGLSGVLLCGLSTAFIFAIMNGLLRMRIESRSQLSE